ncbi:MAG: hypothetical protein GYA43_11185 [Bacteroidales bacterium]|nr:hypothetical protein [Bacteroidales bacterium]
MKNYPANYKSHLNRRIIYMVMPLALVLLSASQDQNVLNEKKDNSDSRLELLNRLERGEKITAGEIKSSFESYRRNSFEVIQPDERLYHFDNDLVIHLPPLPDLPDLPDFESLPGTTPFSFGEAGHPEKDFYNFKDVMKPDTEEINRIRDELSRAAEEMRDKMNEFREKDLQRILDEMKRATEEMKRETERIKEEIRRHREENKNNTVSGVKTV